MALPPNPFGAIERNALAVTPFQHVRGDMNGSIPVTCSLS
jgi:hypothetical protein